MLTQLALDLKDRNLSDGMLVKLVLINISAQAYALPKAPSKLSTQSNDPGHNLNQSRDSVRLSPG